MTKVISDVSKLTNVPVKLLEKLSDKVIYSINDAVEESVLSGEYTTDIDLGIGTLSIYLDEDCVKYKFIPSAKLMIV